MNNNDSDIHEIIKKHLNERELDVVGIVPISLQGDRMVRLRTLQEMIEEFEENSTQDTVEYLIQIKPKRTAPPTPPQKPTSTPVAKLGPESIYLPNGKMNVPFLLKNGDLLLDSGEFSLARNIYNSILRSGEHTGATLFRLGKCFEAEGKDDDARATYEEAIAYHPTLDCYHRLATLLMRQKKDLQAAEIYGRALYLKDLSSHTRFELHKAAGNCYTRGNKLEEAENQFKKALEIDTTADEVRSNLGALYLQTQKTPEARRHFRDALASNPRNHLALAGLGSCFLAEGDKKSAHDLYIQSLEIEINNPTALFHLVKCAYEIKIYASAARILQEYIQIAPINTSLLYSLAGLQFHLGRMDEAKSSTLKILELQPQHTGAKDMMKLIEQYSGSSSL